MASDDSTFDVQQLLKACAVAGIPRVPATSPGRGGGGGGGNGSAGGEAGSYPPFDVGLLRAYVEHWFESGMLVRKPLLQPDEANSGEGWRAQRRV